MGEAVRSGGLGAERQDLPGPRLSSAILTSSPEEKQVYFPKRILESTITRVLSLMHYAHFTDEKTEAEQVNSLF